LLLLLLLPLMAPASAPAPAPLALLHEMSCICWQHAGGSMSSTSCRASIVVQPHTITSCIASTVRRLRQSHNTAYTKRTHMHQHQVLRYTIMRHCTEALTTTCNNKVNLAGIISTYISKNVLAAVATVTALTNGAGHQSSAVALTRSCMMMDSLENILGASFRQVRWRSCR
jgi:hypothetical protein